jgi:succinate-semialdehyde dehydrogenase/glutarate-semialdehyde dehydrogenase
VLTKLAAELRRQQKDLAKLIQDEMGKTLQEAEGEIEKCAGCADYYVEHGEDFLADIPLISEENVKAYAHFSPLGTVLAVMPWNFPFWQAMRCLVPAIMAGNTVLLKHASNVSGCSLAIEDLFSKIAAPKGLFQSLLLPGAEAEKLLSRPEVHALSFTGSTPVGSQLAAAAGKNLKKAVLELGGSDAYIVLKDADLEKAANICAKSRLVNAGQSCIAAKRFIIEETVYEKFSILMQQEMQKIPLAPLARNDLREALHKQVVETIQAGAILQCGGKIPDSPGYFYPATILKNVTQQLTAFHEELFGPVAVLVKAKDRKDAIRLANHSEFGLGAAIFSADKAIGEKIARDELEAGSCFVNDSVRSDARLPFGGIKNSGFGRELSYFGIREFTNTKTVYIA